jgi:hypothetical protein
MEYYIITFWNASCKMLGVTKISKGVVATDASATYKAAMIVSILSVILHLKI